MSKGRAKRAAEEVKGVRRQRQATHGDFTDGARFCQAVMRAAQDAPRWDALTDVQKECFHHIVQKLQRVVCGNPNEKDHWVDVAGYAMIAADRIK